MSVVSLEIASRVMLTLLLKEGTEAAESKPRMGVLRA